VVGLALVWFVAESFRIRPHYLAYFNQLVGGPAQGCHHLVDSSLDWGQDLPGLKAWLEEQAPSSRHAPRGEPQTSIGDAGAHHAGHDGNVKHPTVYLSYFGTGSPEYYGIQAEVLPSYFPRPKPGPVILRGGVYCISATMLQGVYLDLPGPWTDDKEKIYRELRKKLDQFDTSADQPALRAALLEEGLPSYWPRFRDAYEQLQFNRLCTVLRQREPNHQIGYSILVYLLTDAEVRAALQD
jgi:hypothetical protein